MADPDKDRVLKKTITIKRRTLKPYEKKFRRQNMNKLNYIYIIKVSHIAVNK
jgi:hypothetical protein